MSKIENRLKERRKELGLTLDSLSKSTGIPKTTLYRYEQQGLESAGVEKIRTLAKHLDVSMGWLISGDDEFFYSEDDIKHILNKDDLMVARISPNLEQEVQNRPIEMKEIHKILSKINYNGLLLIHEFADFIHSKNEYNSDGFIIYDEDYLEERETNEELNDNDLNTVYSLYKKNNEI